MSPSRRCVIPASKSNSVGLRTARASPRSCEVIASSSNRCLRLAKQKIRLARDRSSSCRAIRYLPGGLNNLRVQKALITVNIVSCSSVCRTASFQKCGKKPTAHPRCSDEILPPDGRKFHPAPSSQRRHKRRPCLLVLSLIAICSSRSSAAGWGTSAATPIPVARTRTEKRSRRRSSR